MASSANKQLTRNLGCTHHKRKFPNSGASVFLLHEQHLQTHSECSFIFFSNAEQAFQIYSLTLKAVFNSFTQNKIPEAATAASGIWVSL